MTRRTIWAVVVGVAALISAGCEPPGPIDASAVPAEQVDHVDLLLMPTAVDIETTPGPDGLQMRAFFYHGSSAETIPAEGKLDVFLYDGRVSRQELPWAQAIHHWTFTGEELTGFRNKALGLWNYHLMLLWAPARPQASTVTVAARYTQPDGVTVPSEPVLLMIGRP